VGEGACRVIEGIRAHAAIRHGGILAQRNPAVTQLIHAA